ncbi:MAG TPA: ankyrin repeat domain-containing protein [Patescibacteria group bacterium]|nr:ankyrin repeat domain-containing protein [Patescibacteria group bacterium]
MASPDGKMSQAEIEALLASGIAETEKEKTVAETTKLATESVLPDSAETSIPEAPGGMMSQDEIAAMLASMPENSETAVTPENQDAGNLSEPGATGESADGGMSPTEMEAFMAALQKPREDLAEPGEPVTAAEETPAAAAPAPANESGGAMSQDEIAAMLAAMEPTAATPGEAVTAAAETPAPVAPAPASESGGAMSQDEIAAMLAAMEPATAEPGEAVTAAEETPAAEAPAPANESGGAMSQDEIAAMLAAMEPPAAEPGEAVTAAAEIPAAEPAAAAPAASAPAVPGAMMSQDEIEAMMAALNNDLADESQSIEVQRAVPPSAPAEKPNVMPEPAPAPAVPEVSAPAAQAESNAGEVPATAAQEEAVTTAEPKKKFFLLAIFAGLSGIFRRGKAPVETGELTETPATGILAKLKAVLPFRKKAATAVEAEAEIPDANVLTTADFHRTIIYLVAALALFLPIAMGAGTYLALTYGRSQPEVSPSQVMLANMGIGFYAEDFVKQAGRGNKEAVNLFVEAGMSPDAYRPADGFTPMMAAASYGKQDIIRLLLGKGANPNAKDKDGQTALMKAVAANQALAVRVLMQSGADVNMRDAKGRTAISIAKEKKDPKVVEFMLDLGVKELEPVWQQIKPAERKAAPRASESTSTAQKTPPSVSQGQAPPVNLPAVSGKPATEFGIDTGRVGFAELGKSVDTLFTRYDRNSVTFGEELFAGRQRPVASVYLPGRNSPSLKLNLLLYNQEKDRMIVGIQVLDERFRTGSGATVGSTLGDLRQGGGTVNVRYLDAMMVASGKETRVMYELDIAMDSLPVDWLKGGDLNTLPDNMRIRSILVY